MQLFTIDSSFEPRRWELEVISGSIEVAKIFERTIDLRSCPVFELKGTKKVCSISYGVNFFIDEDVVGALSKDNITGWSYFPIPVHSKRKIPKFFGLVVLGRALDESKMKFTPGHPITIAFDVKSWDGSDVFCLENYGFVFVTQRFVDTFRNNGFNGLSFTPIDPQGTTL